MTSYYKNILNYLDIDYLDLFDNIQYKYIKSIIKQNKNEDDWVEDQLDVKIEDVECDRVAWCSIKISFELEIEVLNCIGENPHMVPKTFEVIIEYNGSSPMAMYIGQELARREDDWDSE